MRTSSWLLALVLTILLGCTASSMDQGMGYPMANPWEYKVVALTEDPKHVEATFNALSQQGWEFASAIRLRAESADCAVFKRPKR